MGVGPLIEKLEKERLKPVVGDLHLREEPSDSDSDEDDERFGRETLTKGYEVFQKKHERHEELLRHFVDSGR